MLLGACTKVVLGCRKFSSSSSQLPAPQIAPHTKVALQSRQFSSSSSTDAVPATKSAHGGSQSAVPGTKSAHGGSQSAAPATKSAHGGSQSAAPATKSAPRGSHSAVPATKSAHGGSHSAVPATKFAHGGSHSTVPATKSAHQAPQTARKCHRQSGGAQTTPARRQGVHPTPWRAPSAAHSAQMLPAERRCPDDASATPGRTSNPLASSKHRTQHANATGRAAVPRRRQGDARAYIRPFGKQQAPRTARTCYRQSGGAQTTPARRQGVPPTPWQAATAAHSTQMLPAERRCPDDASATPGRTSNPLASSKRRTSRGNSTGRAAAPRRRQGIHPTPWQAASAADSTQMAYIQPLGEHQAPRTARKCYRQSGGAQTTPAQRQGIHPTPWRAPSAAHSTHMLPAERRCPDDASATPGRTSDPLASSKCRTQHANAIPAERRCPDDASATPGRTSDPLASSNCRTQHANATGRAAVPRRRQHDARAYIQPLGKQQAPRTARKCYRQSGGAQTTPARRQGVHPTPWQPWQAASAADSTQMPPAERWCPDDASATPGRTSNPLASTKRRTQHANATGRAAAPRRCQGDAGRTSDPLASSKCRTQHANATGRAAVPRRRQSDARAYIRPLGKQQAPHAARKCYRQSGGAQPTPARRQGVHPTPWRAPSAAHSTRMLPAERRCPDDASATPGRTSDPLASAKCRTQRAHATGRATVPRRRQRDARSHIRPLGQQQAPHTARACYRQSGGAQTTPGRRQGVHPTPWQAASAAHSTQMRPAERRCPDDARAYIRPLGQQQAPQTARKCYRQSGGAQTTPGRTSDPLASSKGRTQRRLCVRCMCGCA